MKTLFLIPLAALAFASPAIAQPTSSRTVVSTAGLDLGTAKGVRALDLRVLHAASALCGTPSPADLRGREAFDQCRADARATADRERARLLASASSGATTAIAAAQ
jgi:UrcA family protein